MFEIAVRFKELASSNLNSLIEKTSSPAKMLRLLQTEIEEAIISLDRDAARAGRRADEAEANCAAQDKAAGDWKDKAKLALASGREDLARAALAEREAAQAEVATLRQAATDARQEQASLIDTIGALEAKLGETRARLQAELAVNANAANPSVAAAGSSRASGKVHALNDQIATLEKRIGFAQAAAATPAQASSLDEELAALTRDAKLEAELASLKKSLKKGAK